MSDGDFQTEVAVKLLKSEEISRPMLARFKDEARMLGLIRDRAVVRVFPPAMLDGTPALIMEYVDGQSTSGIMKSLQGPLPQRVVTEIIAEVARALHDVYHQPGPTGEPLRLVHRDIKPANLQVTPNGTVKVLDFGIAKAAFEGRESETTVHLFGTPQYMAPERLQGRTGPASDIFSLGCTWRRLMTGDRPIGGGQFKRSTKPPPPTRMLEEALALIDRMLAIEEEDRPDAAEVHELCTDLAHRMGGQSLRQWASDHVSSAAVESDDLTGTVMMDSIAVDSAVFEDSMPTAGPTGAMLEADTQGSAASLTIERSTATRAMVALLVAAVFAITLALGIGAAALYLLVPGDPPDEAAQVEAPVPSVPEPVPEAEPTDAPDEATDAPVEPSPAAPETPPVEPEPAAPVVVAPSAPAVAPVPPPVPEPVEPTTPEPPAPAPEPAAAMGDILVDAGGAIVVLRRDDGTRVDAGRLPPGRYTVTVAFDKAHPAEVDTPLPPLDLAGGQRIAIRCLAASRRCVLKR